MYKFGFDFDVASSQVQSYHQFACTWKASIQGANDRCEMIFAKLASAMTNGNHFPQVTANYLVHRIISAVNLRNAESI